MNNINIIRTISFSVLLAIPASATETQNPVQAHVASYGLQGRIVYQWKIDLNNDGRPEILLATKPTPEEDKQEILETKGRVDLNIRAFDVYIAKSDGSGYIKSAGTDYGDGFGPGLGAPLVNIARSFVGQITQLNKWGLVTIQTDYPRKDAAVFYIYAYTIEGDHLKQTLLAQGDPAIDNAIYEQYLSDTKRTKIQLQEVTP